MIWVSIATIKMYTSIAIVIIILHLLVIWVIMVWTAIQVSAVLYVFYEYCRELRTIQRMRAGADFGFMIVTLAYVAVIAANKYGPELLAYINAHWTECLYFIDILIQSSKTIPSVAVLLQLYELYPHVAALIVHTPEYNVYYEQILHMQPNELVSAVVHLGDQLVVLGQRISTPVIGEYTEAVAARMHLQVLQLVVENHSDWATYFNIRNQGFIRAKVTADNIASVNNAIRVLLNNELGCRVFERMLVTEIEAINIKFKMICEIIKQRGI